MVDQAVLTSTRLALHTVAEFVIAGPQLERHGTLRLQVLPRGFGSVEGDVRVDGTELVWPGGRREISGTATELAVASGASASAPGSYADHAELGPDEPLEVDPEAVHVLLRWFEQGDKALRAFAPDCVPVLWPEHFDVAITSDEVNYGVSPGDSTSARPYAYVAPWTVPEGNFWNVPFGAARSIDEVGDADALAGFFRRGRAEAS